MWLCAKHMIVYVLSWGRYTQLCCWEAGNAAIIIVIAAGRTSYFISVNHWQITKRVELEKYLQKNWSEPKELWTEHKRWVWHLEMIYFVREPKSWLPFLIKLGKKLLEQTYCGISRLILGYVLNFLFFSFGKKLQLDKRRISKRVVLEVFSDYKYIFQYGNQ